MGSNERKIGSSERTSEYELAHFAGQRGSGSRIQRDLSVKYAAVRVAKA